MCLTEQEKWCNDSHLQVQTQVLDKPAGGALLRRRLCYITLIAASRFHEDLPGSRSDARALFLQARSGEILQLVRERLHAVITMIINTHERARPANNTHTEMTGASALPVHRLPDVNPSTLVSVRLRRKAPHFLSK